MLIALALSSALAVQAPRQPECPAAASLIDRYGISFAGFSQDIPRVDSPDERGARAEDLVMIRLQNKGGPVMDGFHHSAWLNKAEKRAWILRTGGFIGVHEWYGPVELVNVELKGCLPEPTRGAK